MKFILTILGTQPSEWDISSLSQIQSTDTTLEPVSVERVQECFERDLDLAIDECVALYGDTFHNWPEEVKQVIANMMFNMGLTRLSKFK